MVALSCRLWLALAAIVALSLAATTTDSCPGGCSGHGVCQEDTRTCDCYRGYSGKTCDQMDVAVNSEDLEPPQGYDDLLDSPFPNYFVTPELDLRDAVGTDENGGEIPLNATRRRLTAGAGAENPHIHFVGGFTGITSRGFVDFHYNVVQTNTTTALDDWAPLLQAGQVELACGPSFLRDSYLPFVHASTGVLQRSPLQLTITLSTARMTLEQAASLPRLLHALAAGYVVTYGRPTVMAAIPAFQRNGSCARWLPLSQPYYTVLQAVRPTAVADGTWIVQLELDPVGVEDAVLALQVSLEHDPEPEREISRRRRLGLRLPTDIDAQLEQYHTRRRLAVTTSKYLTSGININWDREARQPLNPRINILPGNLLYCVNCYAYYNVKLVVTMSMCLKVKFYYEYQMDTTYTSDYGFQYPLPDCLQLRLADPSAVGVNLAFSVDARIEGTAGLSALVRSDGIDYQVSSCPYSNDRDITKESCINTVLPDTPLPSIVVYAGAVPISVTPRVRIDAAGYATAYMPGYLQAGANATASVTLGATVSLAGLGLMPSFTGLSTFSATWGTVPFVMTGFNQFSGDVVAHFYPQVTLAVLDSVPVYAKPRVEVKVSVALSWARRMLESLARSKREASWMLAAPAPQQPQVQGFVDGPLEQQPIIPGLAQQARFAAAAAAAAARAPALAAAHKGRSLGACDTAGGSFAASYSGALSVGVTKTTLADVPMIASYAGGWVSLRGYTFLPELASPLVSFAANTAIAAGCITRPVVSPTPTPSPSPSKVVAPTPPAMPGIVVAVDGTYSGSLLQNQYVTYALVWPTGATSITFSLSVDSGDQDLFAFPTYASWNSGTASVSSVNAGNDAVTLNTAPSSGYWLVVVLAYRGGSYRLKVTAGSTASYFVTATPSSLPSPSATPTTSPSPSAAAPLGTVLPLQRDVTPYTGLQPGVYFVFRFTGTAGAVYTFSLIETAGEAYVYTTTSAAAAGSLDFTVLDGSTYPGYDYITYTANGQAMYFVVIIPDDGDYTDLVMRVDPGPISPWEALPPTSFQRDYWPANTWWPAMAADVVYPGTYNLILAQWPDTSVEAFDFTLWSDVGDCDVYVYAGYVSNEQVVMGSKSPLGYSATSATADSVTLFYDPQVTIYTIAVYGYTYGEYYFGFMPSDAVRPSPSPSPKPLDWSLTIGEWLPPDDLLMMDANKVQRFLFNWPTGSQQYAGYISFYFNMYVYYGDVDVYVYAGDRTGAADADLDPYLPDYYDYEYWAATYSAYETVLIEAKPDVTQWTVVLRAAEESGVVIMLTPDQEAPTDASPSPQPSVSAQPAASGQPDVSAVPTPTTATTAAAATPSATTGVGASNAASTVGGTATSSTPRASASSSSTTTATPSASASDAPMLVQSSLTIQGLDLATAQSAGTRLYAAVEAGIATLLDVSPTQVQVTSITAAAARRRALSTQVQAGAAKQRFLPGSGGVNVAFRVRTTASRVSAATAAVTAALNQGAVTATTGAPQLTTMLSNIAAAAGVPSSSLTMTVQTPTVSAASVVEQPGGVSGGSSGADTTTIAIAAGAAGGAVVVIAAIAGFVYYRSQHPSVPAAAAAAPAPGTGAATVAVPVIVLGATPSNEKPGTFVGLNPMYKVVSAATAPPQLPATAPVAADGSAGSGSDANGKASFAPSVSV